MKLNYIYDLELLNNKDLIAHKHHLERWKDWALEEVNVFAKQYEEVLKLLRERLHDLEYDAAEAELDRVESSTVADFAQMEIH